MSKVLVLDADQRSALAVIRSLGGHGIEVVAGDHVTDSLGAASKYSAESVLYPNPAKFPSLFVKEITTIVRRHRIDVIFPTTDLTTMLLASQPGLLQTGHLAAPSIASYEMLTDKACLLTLAEKLGISIPETRIAHTSEAIAEAAREFRYPIVLKPARSRYLKKDRVVSTSVETVRSPSELSDALRRQHWLSDIPCLVQRFVQGHGAGVFALYSRSGPIAWFAHRRIREKPPWGGVSVLSESDRVSPAMQTAASQLLSASDWVGVAMVEFRVTGDGIPYLMEVNGRFWGSLQLAIDCGIDFPWLLYQVTQGTRPPTVTSYAQGTRLRWVLGDLDSLLIALRRGDSSVRHKGRAVGAFLASFFDRGCRQEILRASDLAPGIREVRHWLRGLRHARK